MIRKMRIGQLNAAAITVSGLQGVFNGGGGLDLLTDNPEGGLTVNPGIVSARGRYQDTCAQVSALINYGNLGGPVVDPEGRVVGLANHLTPRTPWRQNCGVGFVLYAEKIREVLPLLKEGKKIERPVRPFLGIQADNGALDVQGARILHALPNGAAAQAGLKDGDVIVEFDGQPVEGWVGLVRAIRATKVGQVVKVKVKRNDEEQVFQVTVGQQD
jgi:serine protease Do